MTRKELEQLTVKELREESRERGLTCEHKGKKFTKAELIDRIVKYDKEQEELDEEMHFVLSGAEVAECEEETEIKENKIGFAKTLEQIEEKYSGRKKQSVYDNELREGSFVVFIRRVSPKAGGIYKKLGTAKVTAVDREREIVDVETILGEKRSLCFEELLYIRKEHWHKYPSDIAVYLHKQRTEKGRILINERYAEIENNNDWE